MVAGDKETAFEVAVKVIASPVWLSLYLAYLSCRKTAEALTRPERAEQKPMRLPATEVERAVYAALVLAGEPVNNRRLAELMGCSPGEASKRVARLEGVVRKVREGREVMIGLR